MLVAFNLAKFRKAAGLTQKQFGERFGLSEASVSAAERSWDSKRVREFDADEIVRIGIVLDVPVAALLLPPSDAGTAADYAFTVGPGDEHTLTLREWLRSVVPDFEGDSPAMTAFRARLAQLGGKRLAGPAARDVAEQERAEAEAARILGEARRNAESITSDSRAKAENLERDARERHRQAMAALVQSREELERRVDDLRMFEREYRRRLLEFLEAQVADLRAGPSEEGPQ